MKAEIKLDAETASRIACDLLREDLDLHLRDIQNPKCHPEDFQAACARYAATIVILSFYEGDT